MKAITVKFFGPGNVRGLRYKATDSDRNTVILSADDSLSHEQNCDKAAVALCVKMDWTQHNLVRGGLPNGDHVYVFDAEMNHVNIWNVHKGRVAA
jgi:hypothetical protein